MKPSSTTESKGLRLLLIITALLFLAIFVVLPALMVFYEALHEGVRVYIATFNDPTAIAAIKLSLIVAISSVLLNLSFGLAASWSITKFEFVGKQLLTTLIDLPFSVSPVIAGLIYVILFGGNTVVGSWLLAHNISIIFAVPGLILATTFVTFPFIARELIPLMQGQGNEEEEVATSLGANGWQIFWRVTLPNIKWGLLYGILLCNARAMGEFGAVSVVSGHIRGATTTIPLYVEILYNEYNYSASFAMASILTILALLTLVLKTLFESKERRLK